MQAESDMSTASKFVLIISMSIISLVSLCVVVDFWIDSPFPLSIALVGSGILSFALCIILSEAHGTPWISDSGHIRATIAISIVVEYLVLVGLTGPFNQGPALDKSTVVGFQLC